MTKGEKTYSCPIEEMATAATTVLKRKLDNDKGYNTLVGPAQMRDLDPTRLKLSELRDLVKVIKTVREEGCPGATEGVCPKANVIAGAYSMTTGQAFSDVFPHIQSEVVG